MVLLRNCALFIFHSQQISIIIRFFLFYNHFFILQNIYFQFKFNFNNLKLNRIHFRIDFGFFKIHSKVFFEFKFLTCCVGWPDGKKLACLGRNTTMELKVTLISQKIPWFYLLVVAISCLGNNFNYSELVSHFLGLF
jgi:hypothetical protein